MTLGQTVLTKVYQRAPFENRIEQIFAHDHGLRVRCEMSEANRLGCALTHLEIASEDQTKITTDELAKRVDDLCAHVTYLLEPLRTVEIDRNAHSVLVRSREPRRKDDELAYYELIADEKLHLTLRRYSYSLSQRKRYPVPFVLSRDQLGILLDDLSQTVSSKSSLN